MYRRFSEIVEFHLQLSKSYGQPLPPFPLQREGFFTSYNLLTNQLSLYFKELQALSPSVFEKEEEVCSQFFTKRVADDVDLKSSRYKSVDQAFVTAAKQQ